MFDVFQISFHKTRRKGVGIIECLILMVILGVTFGAIFTTMAWAQRSYTFSKQDKESRELFFSWVQNFESLWRIGASDTDADKNAKASTAIDAVARIMNGTPTGGGSARIGAFTVSANNKGRQDGRLVLGISITTTGRTWVTLDRSFNWYSNETVSDDAV